MQNERFFLRPELAARVSTRILDSGPMAVSASGLFLSAPRRTGKTTFLREDLVPALRERGATVLYSDLWLDPDADPGEVITSVIREALAENAPAVAKIAKRFGLDDTINFGAVKVAADRLLGAVGLGGKVSLTEALRTLSDETKKTVVLVIDEAQHTMTTEKGRAVLFALKAARDELNSSAHHGLRIVATGSNQEKLSMLRGAKDQAFYLAPMFGLPHLDQPFVDWFCRVTRIDTKVNPPDICRIFEDCGYRPEILAAATDYALNDFSVSDNDASLSARIGVMAKDLMLSGVREQLRVVRALTPIQSAVLRVMVNEGDRFAPFEEKTIRKYRKAFCSLSPEDDASIDVSSVQTALDSLRSKKLIWKESRGVYSIEDQSLGSAMSDDGMLNCLNDTDPDRDRPR